LRFRREGEEKGLKEELNADNRGDITEFPDGSKTEYCPTGQLKCSFDGSSAHRKRRILSIQNNDTEFKNSVDCDGKCMVVATRTEGHEVASAANNAMLESSIEEVTKCAEIRSLNDSFWDAVTKDDRKPSSVKEFLQWSLLFSIPNWRVLQGETKQFLG